jgi:hypothetical protein
MNMKAEFVVNDNGQGLKYRKYKKDENKDEYKKYKQKFYAGMSSTDSFQGYIGKFLEN